MVVWLFMFSIFPHFVLRNISLALAFDVLMFAKLLLTPFLLLCTVLVCSVIYAFPKKKEKALPLSRERELSLLHSQSIVFVNVLVMVVKITALREAKLSSFEKEMYLRLLM